MRRIAPLAFAALFACGNPDNLVVGSYALDSNTNIALPEVRSSIFGTAQVTVAPGTVQPMQVIVVSNASDLCTKLGQNPDYFHNNNEPSLSFVMWITPDRIGDFLVGQNGVGSEIVLGTSGVDAGTTTSPTRSFPAVLGDINVGQQDSQLQGGFDIAYLMNNQAPEFVGRFKANPCSTLAGATVP